MIVVHHRAQDVPEIRAEYAEIDVMMTADRIVVCRHDHVYKGETVWSQKYVPDMGMTLTDFAESFPIKLLVELKLGSLHLGAGLKDFERQVVAQAPDVFAYLSFDFGSIYRLRQNSDTMLIVNTHDNRLPAPASQVREIAQAICVPLPEMKHHVLTHDLPVYVYAVNTPAQIEGEPIAGVITDYPELWK